MSNLLDSLLPRTIPTPAHARVVLLLGQDEPRWRVRLSVEERNARRYEARKARRKASAA